MRISSANGAYPAFPKPSRQDRNPENVSYVKRPHLHCPARLPTRKTKVIAKRYPLRPPMINTNNNMQLHLHHSVISNAAGRLLSSAFARANASACAERTLSSPVSGFRYPILVSEFYFLVWTLRILHLLQPVAALSGQHHALNPLV